MVAIFNKVIIVLIFLYLLIQLAGIIYISIGIIDGTSYILGWLTGAFASFLFMILLIVAILKEEAKRILEVLLSKIL